MSPHRAVGVLILALAGCKAGSAGSSGEFDGSRALGYVERQLAFGPRIPNSAGHRAAGDWLAAELAARADTVIVQAWTHVTGRRDTLALRNFFARFRPEATDRVLYVAHWDSRPAADRSANLAAQRQPVPGANDGGSGVAVLLGVADALKARPPAVGVDLLLVDGEDWGDFADSTESLLGSRYFAAHLPVGYQPLFGVVFDMVGDRDLQLYWEGYSQAHAPEVVQRVWSFADRLGYGRVFQPGVRHTLIDDHVPLQQAGLRVIDVIDFDYEFWHTTEDTIDKIAAASLKIVGDVAIALVR
jgi:Zn-dependent M28 family amino/carboxypeptidase